MVKITADMIQQCAQYTNAVKEREIDMRGYKISVIENLGATLDQFESIDLSDNDLRKLEGFPLLKRLKTLLLNNNRICRFEEDLQQMLPQLNSIIMTNNSISELADIENLATVKTLEHLSFLRNPVTKKANYRLFLIYKLPQLRVLDFVRIRQKDREAAQQLFGGKSGDRLKQEILSKRQNKTFEPTAPQQQKRKIENNPEKAKDVSAIKLAIAKATTLDEVQRLEQMLKHGRLVDDEDATIDGGQSIVETDES